MATVRQKEYLLSVDSFNRPATAEGKDVDLSIGAGVGFDAGNGVGVGADVRYSQTLSEGSTPAVAFGVWCDKGIANGTLGIGFQGAINTGIRDFAASDFTMAIPVRVQCFF